MGVWREDKFHGEGLYIYSNGDRFKGKFQEGKKADRGSYQHKSGSIYDGEGQKDKILIGNFSLCQQGKVLRKLAQR